MLWGRTYNSIIMTHITCDMRISLKGRKKKKYFDSQSPTSCQSISGAQDPAAAACCWEQSRASKVSPRGFHSETSTSVHTHPVKSLRCSINYPIIGEQERNRELWVFPPCAGAVYLFPSLPLLLRSLSLPLQFTAFSTLNSSEAAALSFCCSLDR